MEAPRRAAVCDMSPEGASIGEGPAVRGTVTIVEGLSSTKALVTFSIEGLTPGLHGFHVHETSDFTNGCISAGPHFNPDDLYHGSLSSSERHVGDLGNINANISGFAVGSLEAPDLVLSGARSVLGRSFVVHADPDNLGLGESEHSLTTGNAGSRLACCKITLFNTTGKYWAVPAQQETTPYSSQSRSDGVSGGFAVEYTFLIFVLFFFFCLVPGFCVYEQRKYRAAREASLLEFNARSAERVQGGSLGEGESGRIAVIGGRGAAAFV